MSVNLLVLDVETTLNGNADIGTGHPMCPDNRVVYTGVSWNGEIETYKELNILLLGEPDFVVGHNLAFDLLYLYRVPDNKKWLQEQRLWDTQLAEYILTGQQAKWSSLDELSVKYGLPIKDDKIKKYFEAGVGSDKIPEDEIVPYLKQDISNTEAIAKIQIQATIEAGQLDLMISQMEALQATIEMRFNGLYINKVELEDYTVDVATDFVNIKTELEAVAPEVKDINSASQWSRFFFGGTVKEKVKEPCGLFKNGKTKFKTVELLKPVKGCSSIVPSSEWKSEKTGKVSVDDTTLEFIKDRDASIVVKATAAKLLEYRFISKQLSTYVQGLGKHLIGDKMHGTLNHCATVTGRLSSTSPNLQNISNNPIKKIFTSRFPEGSLVEVDFSQLEVAALAHITKDAQLIKDITEGADIHSELFKDMYGYLPTKEERKPFKSRSFALIYGAGAKTISQQAHCSLDDAVKFIDTFYARYPGVRMWHTMMTALADRDGKHEINKEGLLDKHRTFNYTAETGRKYVFREYYNERSWSASDYSYSPTELKNYPCQGFATGDIVPLMLGIIFRKFIGRNSVLLVNTIHDSIMFDVTKEALEDGFIEEVLSVLNNTHEHFKATFKKPLALKLSASASVGKNWFEMVELH